MRARLRWLVALAAGAIAFATIPGAFAQQCVAECATKRGIVTGVVPGNTTICKCGCRPGETRGPDLFCRKDVADRLPGTPEWARAEKRCNQEGVKTLRRLRAAKAATVSLSEFVHQGCVAYYDAIWAANLGGCQSTCGRQICDGFMDLRKQGHTGRDFDVRAKPSLEMKWPSCD